MVNICVCAQNVQATQVAMSSELKETMLISCDNQHKLRVILADFPNALLSIKTSKQLSALKRKLLTPFNMTLSGKLNPLPMNCDPMSITLQPNTVPICVTTAHWVPKHYKP